jgi:hypothetical protein
MDKSKHLNWFTVLIISKLLWQNGVESFGMWLPNVVPSDYGLITGTRIIKVRKVQPMMLPCILIWVLLALPDF